MSRGLGHRRGSDPELLWLWRGLAATALIQPLAWEPPYAVAALKRQKDKTKTKTKTNKKTPQSIFCKAIFMVLISSFSFCQSVELLISPLNMNEKLAM